MASKNEVSINLESSNQIEREELERTCQSLIVSFVKMKVEGFPSTEMHVVSNTKGLVLSTDKKANKKMNHRPHSNSRTETQVIESSVDGPAGTPTLQSTPTPTALSTLAEQVAVSSAMTDVVPQTLPMEMRCDLSSVKQKDVQRMYNVEEGVQRVREGGLTQVELIVLHWRSYRNILTYELSDFQELQTRFLRYFSAVFADVIELCYPTPEARQGLEGQLLREFQAAHTQHTATQDLSS